MAESGPEMVHASATTGVTNGAPVEGIAHPRRDRQRRRTSRRRILAGVVAAALVLGGGAVGLMLRGGEGYSEATQQDFVPRCTAAAGGAESEAFCRCLYSSIVDDIPFADFKRYRDEFVAGGRDLPKSFQQAIVSCFDEIPTSS